VTEHLTAEIDDAMIPITLVAKPRFKEWLSAQEPSVRAWCDAQHFTAEAGSTCLLPGEGGAIGRVLFGQDASDPWNWALLPARLPAGRYRIEGPLDAREADWAAMAWELACYRFDLYKSKPGKEWPVLAWPEEANRDRVGTLLRGVTLVRDLVNTPAGDLGPEELARTAQNVAERFGAKVRSIVGDALLDENYPLIHAVGRASNRPPRLIDLRWGDEMAPRITLVGKGVCFDSGGLDLKPSSNMKLMKKDMGGAAHALALGQMIMEANLPVRLRILIGAVDNVVSGNAFKPLDIIKSRKGITVEIGNTDAEGRLVLADCLAEAARETPKLLIDFATLTGAARTALGPDLPALFSPDDKLAAAMLSAGEATHDPMWRLPLWKPYRRMIEGKLADLTNASESPHAGAITAALFLQDFVPAGTAWAHLDLFAWNQSARPGRPEGGEAMTLRALYHMIAKKYPS